MVENLKTIIQMVGITGFGSVKGMTYMTMTKYLDRCGNSHAEEYSKMDNNRNRQILKNTRGISRVEVG